jgi:hypothetical protein
VIFLADTDCRDSARPRAWPINKLALLDTPFGKGLIIWTALISPVDDPGDFTSLFSTKRSGWVNSSHPSQWNVSGTSRNCDEQQNGAGYYWGIKRMHAEEDTSQEASDYNAQKYSDSDSRCNGYQRTRPPKGEVYASSMVGTGLSSAPVRVGSCACLRRESSGEPDVGNLHLRFDEARVRRSFQLSLTLLLYSRQA